MGFADLMRAVFEGLCFAARDCYAAMGDIPEGVRSPAAPHGRKALAAHACQHPQCAGRGVSARGSGCGRCGDDRRRATEALSGHGGLRRHNGSIRCSGRDAAPDAGLACSLHDNLFRSTSETREKMRPVWRAMMADRRQGRVTRKLAIIGDHFMLLGYFRAGDPRALPGSPTSTFARHDFAMAR